MKRSRRQEEEKMSVHHQLELANKKNLCGGTLFTCKVINAWEPDSIVTQQRTVNQDNIHALTRVCLLLAVLALLYVLAIEAQPAVALTCVATDVIRTHSLIQAKTAYRR
jgi:hypothetical protein